MPWQICGGGQQSACARNPSPIKPTVDTKTSTRFKTLPPPQIESITNPSPSQFWTNNSGRTPQEKKKPEPKPTTIPGLSKATRVGAPQ